MVFVGCFAFWGTGRRGEGVTSDSLAVHTLHVLEAGDDVVLHPGTAEEEEEEKEKGGGKGRQGSREVVNFASSVDGNIPCAQQQSKKNSMPASTQSNANIPVRLT